MVDDISKEQELLVNIMKVREIEKQYGHISCFDAPKAYLEMTEIQRKICDLVTELSQDVEGVSNKGLFKVFEDIAKDASTIYNMTAEDIVKNIGEGIIKFQTYDLHDFLDQYVLKEKENELFSSLFWFSDIETRIDFLKDRFLCDLDIYFTNFLDYMVLFEVDEEAWETIREEQSKSFKKVG